MSEYKKILIGLNLSEMDHTTIAYAAMVFSLAGGERLYCIHVTRNLAIPPNIAKAYPTMLRPPDEYAADKILASIKQSAGRKLPDMIDVDVVEGNPLDELLRRAQQKNVDMIIMGRKHNEKETRQLPLKLTRKATCAVLIVPVNSPPKIDRMLVPVDFSPCSAYALSQGIALAKAFGLPEIHALNVYSVPTGYHRTGKSHTEFAQIMKNNAISDYREFIRKIEFGDTKVHMHYRLGSNPAAVIRQYAGQNDIDLIITGARGRTPSAAILLGSVTERLIQTTNVPVLAVKRHNSCMTFAKALFKI